MKFIVLYMTVTVFMSWYGLVFCNEWPDWRGPNRDGTWQETGIKNQAGDRADTVNRSYPSGLLGESKTRGKHTGVQHEVCGNQRRDQCDGIEKPFVGHQSEYRFDGKHAEEHQARRGIAIDSIDEPDLSARSGRCMISIESWHDCLAQSGRDYVGQS